MDRNEMDRTKGKTCMVWNILYLFGMVKLCYEMITNGPKQIREKEKHVKYGINSVNKCVSISLS